MNRLKIGAMRCRVTLMREQFDKGAGGRLVLTTPVIADIWAHVEDYSSNRDNRGDVQRSIGQATVRTRYCLTFMDADRARIGTDTYRVISAVKRGILNPQIEMQLQSLTSNKKAV